MPRQRRSRESVYIEIIDSACLQILLKENLTHDIATAIQRVDGGHRVIVFRRDRMISIFKIDCRRQVKGIVIA